MDTYLKYEGKLMNLYPFVKTVDEKVSVQYLGQRKWELDLMVKQRKAVTFCRNYLAITTTDLSKLTNIEKESVENCLKDNFLDQDPDYFGKRDTIFLDLHNY